MNLPTEEELAPSLVKAFTYAQHGRMLAPEDVEQLRSSLDGTRLQLFERLMQNLNSPCGPGDKACGAGKIDELAELYRAWAKELPDDFEVQLTVAGGLFFLGESARRGGFERGAKLASDGRRRVDELLSRFPEEPMVHGQLAFIKTFETGKKEEIRAHIARCLELDPTTDWCRKLARKY
ncbi:MAG: hypothetical protein AAFY60_19960 [Myxococcota bacterium]